MKILIRANVQSEVTEITHCLFEITRERVMTWQKYYNLLIREKEDNIVLPEYSFLESCEFLELEEDRFPQYFTTEEEIYVIPEEYNFKEDDFHIINCIRLFIDGFGNVQFKGYGKYSNEEYYSETINLKTLFSLCN